MQLILSLVLAHSQESAKTFDINSTNTEISFTAKHFGILNVSGEFTEFKGSIVLNGSLVKKVLVEINANTINTGNKNRDKSLKTDVFLNPEAYPVIRYESNDNKNPHTIEGTLSIKNSSNLALLIYETKQEGQSLVLSGNCTIKRDDFDLDFGTMNDLVSNEVRIEVSIKLPF
ncbi:YceI family protein [Fabibacter sp. E12]|nr:YceI family protein [Roseivirga sp. E12]